MIRMIGSRGIILYISKCKLSVLYQLLKLDR